MRKLFVLNIFLVLIVLFACSDPETPVSAVDAGEFPSLTGPYLGQEPPGQEPELFAPGLVSTGAQELSICFSPAGDEVYFFVCGPTFNPRIILHSRRQDSTWTTPRETGFFDADRTGSYPFVAPDGERIFFCSSRGPEIRQARPVITRSGLRTGWTTAGEYPGRSIPSETTMASAETTCTSASAAKMVDGGKPETWVNG